MATIIEPIKKTVSSRSANEMFLKMVLECDCLSDSQIAVMAEFASVYFEQASRLKEIESNEQKQSISSDA